MFIQDCFDALFYFLAMFEHYIARSLIVSGDVAYPIEYYVPRMGQMRGENGRIP